MHTRYDIEIRTKAAITNKRRRLDAIRPKRLWKKVPKRGLHITHVYVYSVSTHRTLYSTGLCDAGPVRRKAAASLLFAITDFAAVQAVNYYRRPR